ncbi:hypothetical protein KOW79_010121 [Hemibagrus wyckioides]|uniref:Uncharacterized protein n=1 Tax=Hemibagrus wyckioides TaxID=337641 RepID=A0A9D3SK80_9TELE|nr:hypothetical protein KOW79_010121 [Hemibagrus wyckioides]
MYDNRKYLTEEALDLATPTCSAIDHLKQGAGPTKSPEEFHGGKGKMEVMLRCLVLWLESKEAQLIM